MAKKQLSFAEKAAKKNKKSDIKYVKYVNSVRSEKTGQWRFNERIIGLDGGESLDVALKRIEEENNLLNIDLSDLKQAKGETEKVESSAQDDSSDKKEAGETVEMKVDDGIMEQADLGESKETPEETVEVTLDGESTEVVSKVEESVEVEDVDLSETVEDTVQVIDKEPGEVDPEENETTKSKVAPKAESSEQ
tara:strand:- start:85 stop:663 length:579 start_codon:yes stop_codon:yes gene_type:complete